MDLGRRRSTGGRGASVVAGSVWESRMKLDEVKGGFKVFNGEDSTEETVAGTTRVKRVQNQAGKRKTWKSETFEGFERSPIQIARGLKNGGDDSGDGIKKSPVQGKRVARSDPSPVAVRRLLKPKPDSPKPDSINATVIQPEKEEAEEIGSGEACKEFGVCEEAVVSSNVETSKSDDDFDDNSEENGEKIEVVDEEMEVEIEEKSVEIQEIKTQETKPNEIDTPETKPREIKAPETKPNKALTSNAEKVVVSEVKKVNFERKVELRRNNSNKVHHQKQSETIPLNIRKQSPVIRRSTVHSTSNKFPSTSASNGHHSFPETHSRLQSFVDLIMWKDISRSVFIFGIGTFTILSSSYTKDLNISFISVISYLGLVYLAAIFLFRSIVCRGVIDMDYTSYVVGEEEAIWVLKLVLPYLNEFLLKLKALFSGDPATTMKLAALLFVLARCGSSITIWTMAKLAFFGVFTVPKVCSLYSTQITAYAKFWVRRFRDAWDSCSHKKGVTVAVFLLVWNLSSIVARIWAVFMLFVAFRYYQKNLVANDWVEYNEEGEETWHEPTGDPRQVPGPTIVDYTKQKKRS